MGPGQLWREHGYEDYDHGAWGNQKTTSKTKAGKDFTSPPGDAGLWSSPVMAANYGCKLTDILDGTTRQFLLGELRAGMVQQDPRGMWALGYPGASIVNAGRDSYNPCPNNKLGGNVANPDADGGDELQDGYLYATVDAARLGMGAMYNTPYPDDMMTSAMARSMHPGGVNMCFCDGSVHFITDQIDELSWCRLSSKNDGQDMTYDYSK